MTLTRNTLLNAAIAKGLRPHPYKGLGNANCDAPNCGNTLGHPIHSNKPQYIETTWELRTYDVWGNSKDGYEVNDSYRAGEAPIRCKIEVNNAGLPGEFLSAYPSDSQIRRALGLRRFALELDGDDLTIYVNRAKDGYLLGELFCTSHESLSPILRFRMKCNQCQMLQINGVPCHEIGCSNMGARWDKDSGEWIKQRDCFECGCTVDADDLCCNQPIEDETEEN
jgi:hypothetical protein